MSQESLDDNIKFRAGPLKQAAGELDAVHLGGINISELAREGLTEMLRRTITDEDMITIYERYSDGDLSEDAARVLLGEEFDQLQADIDTFRDAAEDDTSDYVI
jgi:tRNA U55 pseudouridine synthase TruB